MTRVAMLLENNPYPQDVRVRAEAESLAAAGHAVTVVAPREPGQPRARDGRGVRVRRFRLPATPASPRGFVRRVRGRQRPALLRRRSAELLRGADVVHLHNPPDTLFGVGFLARALGRKVVFDHHDLAPELFEAKFGPGRVAAVLRRLRAPHLPLRDARDRRQRVPPRGRRGTAAASRASGVAVVRNGPPAAAFAGATEGRGGASSEPRLLFLGCMESQDGRRRAAAACWSCSRATTSCPAPS